MPGVIESLIIAPLLGSIGAATILGTTLTVSALVSTAIFVGGVYLHQRNLLKNRVVRQGGTKITQIDAGGSKHLVFGRTEKAGQIIALGTSGGSKNPYLEGIIAFTGHKIQSIQKVKIDGETAAELQYDDFQVPIRVLPSLPANGTTVQLGLTSAFTDYKPDRSPNQYLHVIMPRSILNFDNFELRFTGGRNTRRNYTVPAQQVRNTRPDRRDLDSSIRVTWTNASGVTTTEEGIYIRYFMGTSGNTWRNTLIAFDAVPVLRSVGDNSSLIEFSAHLGYSTDNLFNFKNRPRLSQREAILIAQRSIFGVGTGTSFTGRLNPLVAALYSAPLNTSEYWIAHNLTETMRGEDVGLLFFRVKFDREKLNTFPNITAEIEGVPEVMNYATGQMEYSTNPVWCLVWYLTHPKYGINATIGRGEDDDIDLDSAIAAAAVCDEEVIAIDSDGRIHAEFPWMMVRSLDDERDDEGLVDGFDPDEVARVREIYSHLVNRGGAQAKLYVEKRYTCNGWVSLEETRQDIIAGFLSAMAGEMVVSGAKLYINAGSTRMPEPDPINYEDLVQPVSITEFDKIETLYSGVRGLFSGPTTNYDHTDFPSLESDEFLLQDTGFLPRTVSLLERRQNHRRYIDTGYPMTNSPSMTQRLARQELFQSRFQTTVSFTMNLKGLRYRIGDVIRLNFERFGWDDYRGTGKAKPFRITGITLDSTNENLGIKVDAVEYDDDIFDYLVDDEKIAITAVRSTMPEAVPLFPPRNLRFAGENLIPQPGSGRRVVATIEWSAPENSEFVSHYEVQRDVTHERHDDGSLIYSTVSTPTSLRVDLYDLDARDNHIRVRSVGYDGDFSDWSDITFNIEGLGGVPPQPENLRLEVLANLAANIIWDRITDPDVEIGGSNIVRYSPRDRAGLAWEDGEIISESAGVATYATVPYRVGTYMVRSRNNRGRLSPVSFLEITDEIESGSNAFSEINEHPTFAGTYDSDHFEVFDFALVTKTELDSDGLTRAVIQRGTYEISANPVLLARRATVRLEALVQYTSQVTDPTVRAREFPIREWEGQSIPSRGFSDIDVGFDPSAYMEFRSSNDDGSDPSWSAWRRFDTTLVTCRQLEFRLITNSGRTPYAYPAINAITIRGTLA